MFALERLPRDEPLLSEFIQMRLDRLDVSDTRPGEQFPVPRLDGSGGHDGPARAHVQGVINLLARAGEVAPGERRMLKTISALVKVAFRCYWARIGLGLGYLWAISIFDGDWARYGLGLDCLWAIFGLGWDWAGIGLGLG